MVSTLELTCEYRRSHRALDSVTLRAEPGTIVAVLGGPRSGKTTLVRAFMGRVKPRSGSCLIGACVCAKDFIGTRQIATFVDREMSLYRGLSPRRNVEIFALLAGVSVDSESVEQALRRVGVAERYIDRPLTSIDTEISPLVWLALAVVRNTPAVILDEPMRDCSVHTAGFVGETLEDLRRDGRSILFTTEDLSATRLATRVVILNAGRKVAELTPAELLDQNVTDFLSLFSRRSPSE